MVPKGASGSGAWSGGHRAAAPAGGAHWRHGGAPPSTLVVDRGRRVVVVAAGVVRAGALRAPPRHHHRPRPRRGARPLPGLDHRGDRHAITTATAGRRRRRPGPGSPCRRRASTGTRPPAPSTSTPSAAPPTPTRRITTVTVTPAGCGVQTRWDALQERWNARQLCARRRRHRLGDVHRLPPLLRPGRPQSDWTCAPPYPLVPAAPAAGATLVRLVRPTATARPSDDAVGGRRWRTSPWAARACPPSMCSGWRRTRPRRTAQHHDRPVVRPPLRARAAGDGDVVVDHVLLRRATSTTASSTS